MSSFLIGKETSEYLRVQIRGRSHTSQDYWDGNWVRAEIEIAVGGFRGRYGADLRAEELLSFRDACIQLSFSVSSEASFRTMEQQLQIRIVGNRHGGFTAECEAMDQAGTGNTLTFRLTFDQTEIPAILDGLNAIVDAYPVVGRP